jgi:hypothetical protein
MKITCKKNYETVNFVVGKLNLPYTPGVNRKVFYGEIFFSMVEKKLHRKKIMIPSTSLSENLLACTAFYGGAKVFYGRKFFSMGENFFLWETTFFYGKIFFLWEKVIWLAEMALRHLSGPRSKHMFQ